MKKSYKLIGFIISLIIILSTAGCSLVSQEDLEDLESQIEDLESQVDDLEDEIDEIKSAADKPSMQTEASEDTIPDPEDEEAPEPPQNEQEDKENTSGFSEKEVLSQLEVTEYTYVSEYSNYMFLAVKNNSPYTITIYGETIFKDENGDLIGAANNEKRAFEAGEEILLDFYNEDSFSSYEYSLSADLEEYYVPVLSSLTKELTITDSKVIISVTNNGDIAAQYVEYYVLFFNGDTIVDYGWGYCTDDDSEIKAGKTNYDEAVTYEEFENALVFLSGRASN